MLDSRFWSKVKTPLGIGECWEWIGAKSTNGYGSFWANNTRTTPHRLTYQAFKGSIEKGLEIDHLCRNRSCINPNHLEAVTTKENTNRGVGPTARNSKKTHCPKGHSLTGNNLDKYQLGLGFRMCLTCKQEHNRKNNNARKIKMVVGALGAF